MSVKIPVEEWKEISEGRHEATISNVEERLEPYHYVDVFFKLLDVNVEIKDGFSAKITENTKLGKFLKSMGIELKVGESWDIDSIGKFLKGKKVSLVTINEAVKDKGTFARVVDGSVKLLPAPALQEEKEVCLCGFKLEGNEKFCPRCGAELRVKA